MDFASLKDQVSNLTLYDLKAGVRKVQNAVMNYTEMEAKVREATNNEPWGASTTLMQEIASGTHSYQLLNEIMPMIYKRFTEKAAEEWRQIYKALQLLEFLIKNGSERVIDDARSHLSLLKMLRQFHFIDQNGKDQGINVRNRAKELAELLSDVDRIRSERKKARATRGKYGGVEGGGGLGMSSGSSSRYGGFSSEDANFGGYSGGVYGDGGGFGGQGGGSSFSDTQRHRDQFEEYDEYDEGAVAAPGRRQSDVRIGRERSTRESKKAEPPKPKEPEVDLFDFGDDDMSAQPVPLNGAPNSAGFGNMQSAGADDDDFDDFQSATPSTQTTKPELGGIPPPASAMGTTSQIAAPQPRPAAQTQHLNDLFSTISPAPPSSTGTPALSTTSNSIFTPPSTTTPFSTASAAAPKPAGYQAAQPNYFQSVQMQASTPSGASTPGGSMGMGMGMGGQPSGGIGGGAAAAKPKAAGGGDPFSNLLGGGAKKAAPAKGASMADMAKQKSSAAIWGASSSTTAGSGSMANSTNAFGGAPSQSGGQGQKLGGGLDDLLG